jgi:ribosomal protein S18 acetylase RimI-like enzyme
MSMLGTLTHPQVSYRKVYRLDAARMAEIAERSFDKPSACWDSPDALRIPGCTGIVAEVDGWPVGFIIFKAISSFRRTGPSLMARLMNWWIAPDPLARAPERQICLSWVAVLPEFQRQGIARDLLEQAHSHFRQDGSRFQATVSESNLPVQLLLRGAGYRAVRILRGDEGSEDSYLMVRHATSPCDLQ